MYNVGLSINLIKGLINHGFVIGNIIIDGKSYESSMTALGYNPNKCSMCGYVQKPFSGLEVDRHHVLNRSWKPKFNFKIPLCRNCHDFVHFELPNGLTPHRTNSKKMVNYSLQHSRVVIDNLIQLLLDEKKLKNFDTKKLILPYTGKVDYKL